ncbi:hypothetical protein C2845_PM09G15850 [Panicum miliaceum]|uniref:Uncharacterized protein n=1 Tax=Panicum miliaceum TaxID=4540 RepID=A0A3L6RX13_PANMI|nr:hypothetical protein C2845_PM09G15850 [Panicum miliaceum]
MAGERAPPRHRRFACRSRGCCASDFDYVPATPGSKWVGESAAQRRQRRLSSPSQRTYLMPAFDAIAAGDGGVSGYSSSSSGRLDLGIQPHCRCATPPRTRWRPPVLSSSCIAWPQSHQTTPIAAAKLKLEEARNSALKKLERSRVM